MKAIANILFEAKILKDIPRSGYHFLGSGKESVAEHAFITTFIAYVMAQITPEVDALRLISMCLVHDLPEARIGDLNYVQKKYVTADEQKAVDDATRELPFGPSLADLIEDFNENSSPEAQLAHDADQLAFILELKALSDNGHPPPEKWLPFVKQRLVTETGKKLAETIVETDCDEWWFANYVDSANPSE